MSLDEMVTADGKTLKVINPNAIPRNVNAADAFPSIYLMVSIFFASNNHTKVAAYSPWTGG